MFRRNRIRGLKTAIFFLIVFAVVSAASVASAEDKKDITFLILSNHSHKAGQGITEALKIPEVARDFNIHLYTNMDLEEETIDRDIIARSAIIVVDDMAKELRDYILKNADLEKSKVYGLCSTPKAPDDFIYDPKVIGYCRHTTRKNIKNLIPYLLNKDFKIELEYEEPLTVPKSGIFHPESSRIFSNFEEYLAWYKKKGLYSKEGFWVGITDHSSYVTPGEVGRVETSLIRKLEENSINVLPVYAFPAPRCLEEFLLDGKGKSRVDIIVAFSFKFASADMEKTKKILIRQGVPFLNAIRMFFTTIPEWRESPQGLGPLAISWQICVPEFNGVIEPSVLGGRVPLKDERTGKEVYDNGPVTENIDFFIKRIKAWRNLQTKANKNKRIAVVFWNHPPGKHKVGAAYLNVFRSMEKILERMRKEDYTIKGKPPLEEEIKELILKGGRNIGSWSPGELDELIKNGQVIQVPLTKYTKWCEEINPEYIKKMEDEWGKVEDSKIMIKDKKIIIPCVSLGNVILIPQPSRGWGEDPTKLYHSTTLWPHHQYTAFYLWLKNEFKADAIVSLGTHGTHEWLPGKQAGLSMSCPPDVLIHDIPNIYPYIMDDIGEGIQAKRRGRGVVVDYLIPALKKAGAYHEYRELSVLIDEYNNVLSSSAELAKEKFKRIKVMVKKLGLDKDLLLDEINEEAVEEIEHYLLELQETNVPYGVHTFGISPEGEELEEFSQLIKERNEDLDLNEIKKKLGMCYLEIDRLIAGLQGKYVPAGEGNDPLRNPEAIPTGKNFYGFDPAKVPSKDAYVLGKKQAEEMIQKYLKEKGEYPDKIGLVFFSIELHRNEGTQAGTALYLMGMKPVWDTNNKVIGVEPIPGKLLGRPRIDVHMQTSGLFRDSFPNVILLLDEAVRKASQLKDVENFIAKHSQKIKGYLVEKGYSEEEAENLSKIRVFSARPGSYGTPVDDLVSASGLWESDEEIADVFINFVSFGYGKGVWGKPLKSVYKKNLEDIKITMHTQSSNAFGVMDNDDWFSYLGGLSMAVKRISGEYPDVLISDQRDPDATHIEDIERTVGEELRARYLNPKWIEGMKKENYEGARQMSRFVEFMWGWQVTTPFAVDETKWEQVYEVYVEDKYDLDLKEFFDENSPWAMQSINARMLEAIRKKYWDAPEEIRKNLAKDYAIGVIENKIACCDHICDNPALNQMVVNIISLPGMLSPELVNQFQAVISRATGMSLEEAQEKRKVLQEKLAKVTEEIRQEEKVEKVVKGKEPDKEKIEGYEMVEEKPEENITVSGSSWIIIAIVIGLIGLLAAGWRKKI